MNTFMHLYDCLISNIFSTSRISSFQESWPNLQTWFDQKQNILVRVDADVDEVELYKRVESVLQQVIVQKQEGQWFLFSYHML